MVLSPEQDVFSPERSLVGGSDTEQDTEETRPEMQFLNSRLQMLGVGSMQVGAKTSEHADIIQTKYKEGINKRQDRQNHNKCLF